MAYFSITYENSLHFSCEQGIIKSYASYFRQKWYFIDQLREESRRRRSNFLLKPVNELTSIIPSSIRSLKEYLATYTFSLDRLLLPGL